MDMVDKLTAAPADIEIKLIAAARYPLIPSDLLGQQYHLSY